MLQSAGSSQVPITGTLPSLSFRFPKGKKKKEVLCHHKPGLLRAKAQSTLAASICKISSWGSRLDSLPSPHCHSPCSDGFPACPGAAMGTGTAAYLQTSQKQHLLPSCRIFTSFSGARATMDTDTHLQPHLKALKTVTRREQSACHSQKG